MLVKTLIERLSELNPDENIWATWITRENVKAVLVDMEITDENDNLVEIDSTIVTQEFADDVFNYIDNDDYLWERFNETYNDIVRERYDESLKEKELQELDKSETELWDTNA